MLHKLTTGKAYALHFDVGKNIKTPAQISQLYSHEMKYTSMEAWILQHIRFLNRAIKRDQSTVPSLDATSNIIISETV